MTILSDQPSVAAMLLELIPVPVTDVDRAKAFYADQVGFHVDHDVEPSTGMRIVQLTPPGSACSILLSTGLADVSTMTPGSVKALHLVVRNVEQTRAALVRSGVAVGGIQVLGQGVKYARFEDPDGNSWLLQELPWRTF